MRVLVVGWPSFVDGEATAGDVLSMRHIGHTLDENAIAHDMAWSPRFAPGALGLDDINPTDFSHLIFACGPLHGRQVAELHQRYAHCYRVAIGVSIIDESSRAVTGFHEVLARDCPGTTPNRDLASSPPGNFPDVVGIVLAPGQPEYGRQRRHAQLHALLLNWISGVDCAPLPLETRLDTANWSSCSTVDQFASLIGRTDMVVTSRLHGMVFALAQGIPALTVDPIAGGGKVTAQAHAWRWPAVVGEELLDSPHHARDELDSWLTWCRSDEGRSLARRRSRENMDFSPLITALLDRIQTRSRLTP